VLKIVRRGRQSLVETATSITITYNTSRCRQIDDDDDDGPPVHGRVHYRRSLLFNIGLRDDYCCAACVIWHDPH